jgi:hypothetical protein
MPDDDDEFLRKHGLGRHSHHGIPLDVLIVIAITLVVGLLALVVLSRGG